MAKAPDSENKDTAHRFFFDKIPHGLVLLPTNQDNEQIFRVQENTKRGWLQVFLKKNLL